jgi:hypothetical protein
VLWCIIECKWYKEANPCTITAVELELLNNISKLIIFAGIPFGSNGSGNVISCGHSFGCLIPFHMFVSWLEEKEETKNKIVQDYEIRNGFKPNSTKQIKHGCILETTVLTSTLYHDVKKDEMHIERARLNNDMKKILIDDWRWRENGILWKNYHVQEPLSSKNVLECRVNRIFCPLLPFYFDNYKADYYKYNRTFSLYDKDKKTHGVNGTDFFGHYKDNIIAKVNVEITKEVYEADDFFCRNFDRPVVPLCVKPAGYDFFRFDNDESNKVFTQLNEKYKTVDTSLFASSTRVNLFCWKLNEQTEEVIDSLKSINNKGVSITQLSNGFCFTFFN